VAPEESTGRREVYRSNLVAPEVLVVVAPEV